MSSREISRFSAGKLEHDLQQAEDRDLLPKFPLVGHQRRLRVERVRVLHAQIIVRVQISSR